MAPLDPAVVHKSNVAPLATFAGQALLIAGLTAHILYTIRRAATTLPAASSTRAQQQSRRRNVAIFSTLAALSILSVTTFSIAWRVLSYFEWAERSNHNAPGAFWNGWFGTGQAGVDRWALGDWWSDVDLTLEWDKAALESPEHFLYTCQHFVGLAAAAMFYGVEGRRRNLPKKTIASFVVLSAFGSLGFALNLFFVTMLYTPVALHDPTSPRHDALFAPAPAVLYLPVIGSILYLLYTPRLVAHRADLTYLRAGHFLDLLFLTFAPQIVPLRWGRRHTSIQSAHKSFSRAFYALGFTSMLLHWQVFVSSLLVNTPPWHSPIYDLFLKAIGKRPTSGRFYTTLATTAQKLKLISKHPITSGAGNDIVLTVIGLLAWAFIRHLDVHDLLDNSFLWLLTPPKSEKHVAFKEDVAVKDDVADTLHEIADHAASLVTPKKRGPGRPKKGISNGTDVTPTKSLTAALRRSSQKTINNVEFDPDSDADSTYEPPDETAKAVRQIETDGAAVEDVVAGGEATALALLLTFVGGVGQLAAAVLGAEVTAE